MPHPSLASLLRSIPPPSPNSSQDCTDTDSNCTPKTMERSSNSLFLSTPENMTSSFEAFELPEIDHDYWSSDSIFASGRSNKEIRKFFEIPTNGFRDEVKDEVEALEEELGEMSIGRQKPSTSIARRSLFKQRSRPSLFVSKNTTKNLKSRCPTTKPTRSFFNSASSGLQRTGARLSKAKDEKLELLLLKMENDVLKLKLAKTKKLYEAKLRAKDDEIFKLKTEFLGHLNQSLNKN